MTSILDFLPRNPVATAQKPLLHWLIRRIEVRIRHVCCIISVHPNLYNRRWCVANSQCVLNVRPHSTML